jgi:hypothetical protein
MRPPWLQRGLTIALVKSGKAHEKLLAAGAWTMRLGNGDVNAAFIDLDSTARTCVKEHEDVSGSETVTRRAGALRSEFLRM